MSKNNIVMKYDEELSEILSILGSPEACITDETILSEFSLDDDKMDQIRRLAKAKFGSKALLIHVAEAVRKAARTQKKNKGKRNNYERQE